MIRDGLNKKHTNDPITKLFVSTTINNNNISGGENGFYRESSTSTNSDSMKKEDDVKVGVLMLNLGGPEKTEDVEGKLSFVHWWRNKHVCDKFFVLKSKLFLMKKKQDFYTIYLPIQISYVSHHH